MRKHACQEALQDAERQIENEEKQERGRLQVKLVCVIPACLRDGQVHRMSPHLTAVPAVAASDSICLIGVLLLLHINLVSGPLQCSIIFVNGEPRPDAGPR